MHTVVVVGHVDHGKSTLLGRLLSETGHVRQDRIDHVERICQAKGIELEPAFFLDALEEEQSQGVTIDTTCINFEYKNDRFFLIDAPGHIDFLKNMASGASRADYGILVIDALEGIRAQTKRHLRVLGILGISKVIVAVNKMDKVDYRQDDFDRVAEQIRELISAEDVECVAVVPMSAFRGENVVQVSANMPWYTGHSLLELVRTLCVQAPKAQNEADAPFRMLLQDVYKFDDSSRYFVGRVLAGRVEPGMEVCFSPSGKQATIESVNTFPQGALPYAEKGASVGIKLADQLFVERGEVLSLRTQLPQVDTRLAARIVWMSSTKFDPAATYFLKLGVKQVECRIEVHSDPDDDVAVADGAIAQGDFADVLIRTTTPLAFDRNLRKDGLNKLVLCTTHETVAAGVVDTRAVPALKTITVDPNVHLEKGYVDRVEREKRHSHKGGVIWLTGLSGAGKSTLAKGLERHLFSEGRNVVVLDADNMRLGLCADLGFTPEDRAENVRRIAHVAKLLANNGIICVVAVISPYERDREVASGIIGAENFSEVFVFCPLEVCQQRDPKGLYKRVADGQIESFTGFHQPYQPPQKPDLRLDTSALTLAEELQQVQELLKKKGLIQC